MNKKVIIVEHATLTDMEIPTLFCYPKDAQNLPLVFFMHGFTGSKLKDIGYGIRLAEEGYFVVMIDGRFHGERKPDNFEKIFGQSENRKLDFYKITKGNVEDIVTIMNYLTGDFRISMDRIGIAGVSLGGITSFMLALTDERIKVIAPMIASPTFDVFVNNDAIENDITLKDEIQQMDALFHYRKLYPTAILMQNGADDINATSGARRLDAKMKELYKDIPESYQFIEYPGVGHIVTEEMFNKVISWFAKHL